MRIIIDNMTKLELKAVVQRYGRQTIVNGVDFRLEQGRIACLLGPSGCGKTTLLRCIAGFEDVSGGEILIHDEVMSRPGLRVPPENRQVGMVFQDYALFPHLDVAHNVAFGLHALPHAQRRARVHEVLALVGLEGSAKRYPHELSGGQQQRGHRAGRGAADAGDAAALAEAQAMQAVSPAGKDMMGSGGAGVRDKGSTFTTIAWFSLSHVVVLNKGISVIKAGY